MKKQAKKFHLLTSMGLNSTLHPIEEESGGGGLKRTVCQLVEFMF